MLFDRNAAKKSIAGSCMLILEACNKNNVHYGTYIIRQNYEQFYDPLNAKRNKHYQIFGWQYDTYLSRQQEKGFELIEDPSDVDILREEWSGVVSDEDVHDHVMILPRSKFVYVLSEFEDHYLKDLVVVNNFGGELRGLADKIPVDAIAQMMFVDNYDDCSEKDLRGNLRYDAGYSGQDQTDPNVIPGMYCPRVHKKVSKIEGVDKGDTMEETMHKAACVVMSMSDHISSQHPAGGECELSYPAFRDEERIELFGRRWGDSLGIDNQDKGKARFDSTSCFGTGPTKDHQVKKTEVHADKHNASAEGDNRCPTYTRLSMVKYDGVPHYVRLGFNAYMKQCCSDFMHRLEINNKRSLPPCAIVQ
jgi:hypothetical protein